MQVPINSHESANLNVLVPQHVLARLEATAHEQGRRLPDVIRAILELGLDTYNGQEVRRAA